MRGFPAPITLAIVLALLWALPSSPALASGGGTVEGRVLNGSEEGTPLTDGEVVLSLASDPAVEFTTRTDALGRFRFEGLPTSSENPYRLSVRYHDVEYTLDEIYLSPSQPSAQVEMYVYETTTDTESLKVVLDHHILKDEPEERRLLVVNFIRLLNTGSRTIITQPLGFGPGLPPFIALPEAAENPRLIRGLPTSDADQTGAAAPAFAVPPGEHDVLLTYELPYMGDTVLFREYLDYPVQRLVFLIPEEGVRTEGGQFLTAEEVDLAAGSFQILSGQDIPAGTALRLRLTGLPSGPRTSLLDLAPMAITILAIGALSLGLVAAYFRFRRRRRQYPAPVP